MVDVRKSSVNSVCQTFRTGDPNLVVTRRLVLGVADEG